VTGISNEQCDPNHITQRLNHMKTNVPLADHAVFGAIGNTTVPNVSDEIQKIVAAARAISLRVVTSNTSVNTVANITTAIQDVQAQQAQALYVCTDPRVTTYAAEINQVASQHNLPTMHAFSKNAIGSTSGLFLGFELTDLFSQAADMIYNWRTTQGAAFPNPTTPPQQPNHYP